MKKILAIILFSSILFSCTNLQETTDGNSLKTKVNDLLPKDVIVYKEVNFTNHELKDWVKGVDHAYMQTLNQTVIDSKIDLFEANITYMPKDNFTINDDDIIANITDNSTVNALYFIEKWSFNEENYAFNKEIYSWSPVLEYFHIKDGIIDSSRIVKKLLYDLKGSFEGNEKLIAENIIYEVNFDTERENNMCLNVEKLTSLIINPIIDGKKKAYDFFDKTEKTILDIKTSLGYSVDSMEVENIETAKWEWKYTYTEEDYSTVQAFLFIENWYIDTKSFMIEKRIKSIAPVSLTTRIDADGEAYQVKKILFVVDL